MTSHHEEALQYILQDMYLAYIKAHAIIDAMESGDPVPGSVSWQEMKGLHYACYTGSYDFVNRMIDLKFDVNELAGEAPLHVAVERGHTRVIERLIAANANVNLKDTFSGESALFNAVRYSCLEAFNTLIAAGANVDQANNAGETVLHISASEGKEEFVARLIEHGADVNVEAGHSRRETALHMAAFRGHHRIVEMLLAANCATSPIACTVEQPMTPLQSACMGGHLDIAKLLMDAGNDVNFGICNGSKYCVGSSALMLALEVEDALVLEGEDAEELVDYLIAAGANVNAQCTSDGRTPLCFASNPNMLLSLLDAGADVEATDADEKTPIFYHFYNPDRMQILIEAGANVNKADIYGQTPIFTVTERLCDDGEDDRTLLLIEAGADVNKIDNNGVTPLIKYIQEDRLDKVGLLIEHGADINHRVTATGNAVLAYAFSTKPELCVPALVEAGCDVDIPIFSSQYPSCKTAIDLTMKSCVSLGTRVQLIESFIVSSPNCARKSSASILADVYGSFARALESTVRAALAYARNMNTLRAALGSTMKCRCTRALLQREDSAVPVYECIAFYAMDVDLRDKLLDTQRKRLSTLLVKHEQALAQCENRYFYRRLLYNVGKGEALENIIVQQSKIGKRKCGE